MFLNLFAHEKLNKFFLKLSFLFVIVLFAMPLHSFAGGVNVELNVITTPYYPPPAMVYMPDMGVYVAQSAPFPVFFVGNGYYCFYNNKWYFGSTYNGPWRYRRIVPLQLRKFHPQDWHILQSRAHEYYKNPHWKHFIAQPANNEYEQGGYYKNEFHQNQNQYKRDYYNQYHKYNNQYNR